MASPWMHHRIVSLPTVVMAADLMSFMTLSMRLHRMGQPSYQRRVLAWHVMLDKVHSQDAAVRC